MVAFLATAPPSWADYREAVLVDGPVGYWRFGETSGTSAADEAGGDDGEYLNGPTLGVGGAMGGNTAVALDGVNDYVRIPNSASLNGPASAITLEAWVRPMSAPSLSSFKPVIVKGYTSDADPYYQYGLFMRQSGTTKTFRVVLATGGSFSPVDINTSWTYGAWLHVAVTWDGSHVRLYKNGSLAGTATRSGSPITSYATPLTVGCYENLPKTSSYCIWAQIDEPAVYASALSQNRVQAHYAAAPPPVPTNTSPPTISGTSTQSWTLTADRGTWTDSPTSYAYQWRRCDSQGGNCVDVPNATKTTYTLRGSEIGRNMRVRVTASNSYGSASAQSAPSSVVSGLEPIYVSPFITGCPPGQPYDGQYIDWVGWVCEEDRQYMSFRLRGSSHSRTEFWPCVTSPFWPYNHCDDGSVLANQAFMEEIWDSFGPTSWSDGGFVMTGATGCGHQGEVPCFIRGRDPSGVPIERLRGMCGDQIHAKDIGSCLSDPVQGASGGLRESVTDLTLPGIGLPFEFTRTYNSEDGTSGGFGPGWSFSYGARLDIRASGDVALRAEDGQAVVYEWQANGSFEAPGTLSTLSTVSSGYQLARNDQVTYEFNSAGRLTSIRDQNDQTIAFAYDANGLTSITDTAGRVIDVVANADGLITEVALPDGRDVAFAYADGRLVTVTDVRGGTISYEYTPEGWLKKIIDQNGHTVVENTYDYGGRVVSQLDALGEETAFEWDPATTTLTTTDARGKGWRDVYSGNRLVKRINPLSQTTEYGYDANFNLTSVKDARGNTTTMTYDARGNLLTQTPPTPFTFDEEFTYDAQNNLLSATNGRGYTTTYAYDPDGNLIEKTESGNRVTEYERDPDTGLLQSVTDPRAKTVEYDYDAGGNLTSVTTPSGATTTMTYDAGGRMTGRVDARGNAVGADPEDYRTTFTYDAADQLLTQADPLGHTTERDYDPAGNLKMIIDAEERETEYIYDAADRLDKVIAPDTTVTDYDYNALGNLVARTDAKDHLTTFDYDDAGRLTRVLAPLEREWTYAYDANGNRTQMVDANGNATPASGDGATTYEYDELNRLTQIDYSDTTPDVNIGYDANSNRISMADGAGTQTYVYDDLDRLTSSTRGPDTLTYQYDDVGNVTERTYPGGRILTYTHTDDGQLDAVSEDGQTTDYGYDPAGNLTTTTLPTSNGYVDTRTYDNAGRLTAIESVKGSTPLSEATYALDSVGNPMSVTTLAGTETYEYDPLDRLTKVCYQASCPNANDPFIRYAYDGVGNRTEEERPAGTTTYSYDAADRLTQKTGLGGMVAYDYDQNGNQTAAGSRTFEYDLADRLASTNLASSTIAYAYDGDGTRLEAVSGPLPADTTEYVWDTNVDLPELVRERDGAGTALRDYTYGNDLVSMTVAGDSFYYHYDGIGSVANVTSDTGAVQWTYAYEPFGTARTATPNDPNAPENLMRFTGEFYDAPTGLYHLRARQYDSGNGRFLSTDPLPPVATDPYVSSYVYANGRPTALIDPSGMGAVWAGSCGSFWCWLKDRYQACSDTLACNVGMMVVGPGKFWAPARGARFAAGKWLQHFEKHGAANCWRGNCLGYANSMEYLRGARNVVSGGSGILTHARANGDQLFYNPTTNEFVAVTSSNLIRTYFKPDQGYSYWLGQIR